MMSIQSATPSGSQYGSPMNGFGDGHEHEHGHEVRESAEDQARYLYAKYFLLFWYLTFRMLFEHTQRQYARACNRIIRQGQESNEKQHTNGVR
jgi:hypothetical protein